MDLKTVVVASVQGADLSLHELLQGLQIKGRLQPLLMESIVDRIIAAAIQQQGLQVTTEELQKAADAFRIHRGLHRTADLQRWLAGNHLTPEELESGLEQTLLTEKLAERVVSPEAVGKHFAENRTRWDRARLAHLVVEKEGLVNELLSQLHEDGADFATLARQHSLDEQTRATGGLLGIIPRPSLTPVMALAVFNAKRGDVVGPFKSERGYQLLKVEELFLGQLAPHTSAIRRLLFRQWVREQMRAARVEIKVHQHL